jgi:hypothetical protein
MLGLASSYRGTMQPAMSKVQGLIFYDEIVALFGTKIGDYSLSEIENYFHSFAL